MRRSKTPSELARLASPLGRLLDAAWRRMHWWVAAMVVLYAVSGITVIHPDEVAVVLRWGRLVGRTRHAQRHGPGLLLAFPRPVDRVVRVKTKHVSQLLISTLSRGEFSGVDVETLDPLTVGYALTGDLNVVHVAMVARYQVRDPAEWAFYGPKSDAILRVEVTAAMMRSLGEMGVDSVLAEGRKDLIERATRRAQAGLDAAHAGLNLVSLELTGLSPPDALVNDFDAVQSAYIGAETRKKNAQAFAQDVVPKARAQSNTAVQAARADASVALARAQGEAKAFLALDREYRGNAGVVRERLYRDAVDKAISSAGTVRWVPPPAAGHYQGLRITLAPEEAGPRKPAEEQAAPSASSPGGGGPASLAPDHGALLAPPEGEPRETGGNQGGSIAPPPGAVVEGPGEGNE
jgi:membrane protease subunit HflK